MPLPQFVAPQGRRGRIGRRLADETENLPLKFLTRKGKDFTQCDSYKSISGGENMWNSIEDFIDDLTCVDEEDDEKEIDNPCEDLSWNKCRANEECEMQNRICIWKNAPANERNLYVMYDWKYLTKDGEETTDTFCRDDDTTQITSLPEFKQVCKKQTDLQACVCTLLNEGLICSTPVFI